MDPQRSCTYFGLLVRFQDSLHLLVEKDREMNLDLSSLVLQTRSQPISKEKQDTVRDRCKFFQRWCSTINENGKN